MFISSCDGRRTGPPEEVAIELFMKSSMLIRRAIKKEIKKKVMRRCAGEVGGEERPLLQHVIARISKCVYKLGHRRVCSLIWHSDAEE